ncbi:MAG: alpha/beta hydrolase [Elusimicrobiota bacterium]
MTPRVFIYSVVSVLVCFSSPNAFAKEKQPEKLFDQIENEIMKEPTSQENAQARFDVVANVAKMLIPVSGQSKVDEVLPPQKFARIFDVLAKRDFKQAGSLIDAALMGLCKLGRESALADIRKVTFPSLDGVKVVGYLFIPESPSKSGFIFAHGGFGRKENWIDLMKDVSLKAKAYALAIDLEGCAESQGYTKWQGRIKDFSYAIDYLEKEFGLAQFAVGGHSGGGAYPAACAAIEDKRISAAILWDCPFDFYDMHIAPGATDPGGNPAPLVERTYNVSVKQNLPVTAPEVASYRGIGERLDEIYDEIEKTLKYYRHPSEMLGKVQKERRLAVLHIIAEDVLSPIKETNLGESFFLPLSRTTSKTRARFLNRPLPFYASGLFNRPEGMWKKWESDLNQPKKTVIIENTTHGFEQPGRNKAIQETIEWIKTYVGKTR